jgi:hypothetical protein
LGPPSAQSPFAACRRYRHAEDVMRLLAEHYFHFIAPTGSCARPLPSRRPWQCLWLQVFAGCCQPLLRNGPSRRYLCRSFCTCLDPYSGSPQGAFPVSSPGTLAFPALEPGRRITKPPTATSVGLVISKLQSFTNVQTRTFARHTGSTHPCTFRCRAAVAFPSAHITVRYLPVQRTR